MALEIDPTFPFGHIELAFDLVELGELEAARAEIERESPDTGQLSGLACVDYRLGRKFQSDAALEKLTREFAGEKPYEIAVAHACRGESSDALEWLERAYAHKDYELSYLKGDTAFSGSVHDDPRYRAFLRKMNLPE